MMKKVAEGQNPHVVRLLGCITIKEPLTLIIEFVKYGDLLSYLRTNRKMVICSLLLSDTLFYEYACLLLQYTGTNTEDDERDDAYVELGDVSPVDLISFAYQITSGMVRIFMGVAIIACSVTVVA